MPPSRKPKSGPASAWDPVYERALSCSTVDGCEVWACQLCPEADRKQYVDKRSLQRHVRHQHYRRSGTVWTGPNAQHEGGAEWVGMDVDDVLVYNTHDTQGRAEVGVGAGDASGIADAMDVQQQVGGDFPGPASATAEEAAHDVAADATAAAAAAAMAGEATPEADGAESEGGSRGEGHTLPSDEEEDVADLLQASLDMGGFPTGEHFATV